MGKSTNILKKSCKNIIQYWLEITVFIVLLLIFVSILTSFIMWEHFFIIDFTILRIIIVIGLISALNKEYKEW